VNLQEFIGKFAEQFEQTERSEFRAGTEFKKLEEWSSLIALSIIAMVDEECDVTLEGDDIRNSKTIEDLYNAVKNRK
jgi:acyl carrier protein